MTLFDIPSDKYSHPDNYKYNTHIKNIAASFDDNTIKILANYHDLGKLSDEFQNYLRIINKIKSCEKDSAEFSKLKKKLYNSKTTHAFESAFIFLTQNNLKISLENLTIFLSILRHHGNLKNTNEYFENELLDEDEILYNYSNFQNKIRRICQIANIELKTDLGDFCELFDTEDFIQTNKLAGLKSYFKIKEDFSKLVFADKFEAIFKQSFKNDNNIDSNKSIDKLLHIINSKQNDLSEVRNKAREEILFNYNNNSDNNIFIIEAPTGLGKTFASLHLALEIVKTKNKRKIITALPMTSIIDQTHKEYSKIFDKEDLLKFHYLTYSKNYLSSENEKDEENKKYQKDDFLSSSWAVDNVIITTFNQLLNTFYSNKNKDLIKFWTLRNSVIILDEIQAIPRILLRDVSQTMNFLSREFNIDFILMSATIPSIKNFLDPTRTISLLDTKYFSMNFNNRYALKFDKTIDEIDKLQNEILEKSEKFNSVLCVVNTKKISLELFQKLEKHFNKDEIILLNTNFVPVHREVKLKNLAVRLRNKEKTVLISTQVIEAGVDLDFDYGFREFAPLSSIIQTAGRVNREGKKNGAKLIITEKIGATPYHSKDLLYDDVIQLLVDEVRENNILELLKKYFSISIAKTTKDTLLIEEMKVCNFENVIKIFNDNFMRDTPYLSSIFIEVEPNLYSTIKSEMDKLFLSIKDDNLTLEEKMNIKSKLKDCNKKISQYVINIPTNVCMDFEKFYEGSEIYYLPFNELEKYYSKITGFDLEKTVSNEILFY